MYTAVFMASGRWIVSMLMKNINVSKEFATVLLVVASIVFAVAVYRLMTLIAVKCCISVMTKEKSTSV